MKQLEYNIDDHLKLYLIYHENHNVMSFDNILFSEVYLLIWPTYYPFLTQRLGFGILLHQARLRVLYLNFHLTLPFFYEAISSFFLVI